MGLYDARDMKGENFGFLRNLREQDFDVFFNALNASSFVLELAVIILRGSHRPKRFVEYALWLTFFFFFPFLLW